MDVKVCKHHQRGYCKFRRECQKHHENEICQVRSCSSKDCRKRHPKLCKYFGQRVFCKYGTGCAYAHVEIVNKSEIHILNEAIKTIRAEIDTLKLKVTSTSDIQKEGKVMMNMIKSLKEDINNIKSVNDKICNKIRILEEEFEESDSEDDKEMSENNDRETHQIECTFCDFNCERENTLRKHIKTKHCKEKSEAFDQITDENDMFQKEIV